jgi:hypothetical protein
MGENDPHKQLYGCTGTNFFGSGRNRIRPELKTSFGRNWNWFNKSYTVICYFVCYQTGKHFKLSRRELANVRIKGLTNVKRHNEVFNNVNFPCVVQISSYLETFVTHKNIWYSISPAMLFLLVPAGTYYFSKIFNWYCS